MSTGRIWSNEGDGGFFWSWGCTCGSFEAGLGNASTAREHLDNHADLCGGPRIMEVLMHEVLRDDFEAWLHGRGLALQRLPFLDESPDLPVYNVAPTPERMRGVSNRQYLLSPEVQP